MDLVSRKLPIASADSESKCFGSMQVAAKLFDCPLYSVVDVGAAAESSRFDSTEYL